MAKAKRNVGSKAQMQPDQMQPAQVLKGLKKAHEDATTLGHCILLVYRVIEGADGALTSDEAEALGYILREAEKRIESLCAATYDPKFEFDFTDTEEEKEVA